MIFFKENNKNQNPTNDHMELHIRTKLDHKRKKKIISQTENPLPNPTKCSTHKLYICKNNEITDKPPMVKKKIDTQISKSKSKATHFIKTKTILNKRRNQEGGKILTL